MGLQPSHDATGKNIQNTNAKKPASEIWPIDFRLSDSWNPHAYVFSERMGESFLWYILLYRCLWLKAPFSILCFLLKLYHFVLLSLLYFYSVVCWHHSYFCILVLHQSWIFFWFQVKLCGFNLSFYSLGCLSNFPVSSKAWSVISLG